MQARVHLWPLFSSLMMISLVSKLRDAIESLGPQLDSMAVKAGKFLVLAGDLDFVLGLTAGFEALGVGRYSISEISDTELTSNILGQPFKGVLTNTYCLITGVIAVIKQSSPVSEVILLFLCPINTS
jgi:hypothetical protein